MEQSTSEHYKKLENILIQSGACELILNGTTGLCLQKLDGSLLIKESLFVTHSCMISFCQDFAFSHGLRLDPINPCAGGIVSNMQLRWHSLIPPLASNQAIFVLRKHNFNISFDHFKMKESYLEILESLYFNQQNILFCGQTGSGKTSLLVGYLNTYASKERVVVLEELKEIPMLYPQWLALVTCTSNLQDKGSKDLSFVFAETLRLRPDRIVVGEMRSASSLVFFEAILSGHKGCLTTLHANHIDEVMKRVEFLYERYNKGSVSFGFNRLIKGLKNTWCVFLERGSPPKIKGIEPLFV